LDRTVIYKLPFEFLKSATAPQIMISVETIGTNKGSDANSA
jgi:hypothetical protein